jgi:hypothetical protein
MGRERKNGKGIRNYGVQVIMGNTCCCGGVAVSLQGFLAKDSIVCGREFGV